MNRCVSRTAVALLLLTLVFQAPAAFAASRDRAVDPDFGITRIVKLVKKLVKNLIPVLNDESVVYPKPPNP